MSRRSKVLTFGLPVVGLGALIAGGVTVAADRPSRPAEVPPRPPTASPGAAGLSDADAFIGAIGLVEPAGEAVAVATHTPGVVESVLVGVGDAVSRGDALFRIDPRRAEALLRQRERGVEVAASELAALIAQTDTVRAELDSAQAAVRSAGAGVEAARADASDQENRLRTAEAIDDPRAIAQEELQTRRFALARARAAVAQAESLLAEAGSRQAEAAARLALLIDPITGDPGPDVRAAQARLALAEADREAARVDLELLTVTASEAGTVLQVNTRAGEYAATNPQGDSLMVLSRGSAFHVRAQIDEVDIARFRRDARAWGSLRGDPGSRFELRVALVEPLVVPKTQLTGRTSEIVDTRVLEVVFEPIVPVEGLFPGRQVDVYIEARALGGGGS